MVVTKRSYLDPIDPNELFRRDGHCYLLVQLDLTTAAESQEPQAVDWRLLGHGFTQEAVMRLSYHSKCFIWGYFRSICNRYSGETCLSGTLISA